MNRRVTAAVAAAWVAAAAGCGDGKKPVLPDKEYKAPGSDAQGEQSGGKGKKDKGDAAADG